MSTSETEIDYISEIEHNIHKFSTTFDTLSESDQTLVSSLLSHFSIFQGLEISHIKLKEDCKKLLPFMKFKVYSSGTAIYHEGSIDDKFLFILQGTVNIFVPKTETEMRREQNQRNLDKYR